MHNFQFAIHNFGREGEIPWPGWPTEPDKERTIKKAADRNLRSLPAARVG